MLVIASIAHSYLHSTMYLFQRNTAAIHLSRIKFTFHYVSISTALSSCIDDAERHLHSTMYLFQLFWRFNNISDLLNLHSTMYLFQPARNMKYHMSSFIYIPLCIYFNLKLSSLDTIYTLFTFHYVSISTMQDPS